MIECITGKKGKGKTKHLLEKVRYSLINPKGSIVYLDKSPQHMYELDPKVRLIDVSDYGPKDKYEFYGFILGILSQNHDVEKVFLDSFLDISFCKKEDIPDFIYKLEDISDRFDTDFIISISADINELPEEVHKYVTVSL